MRSLRHELYVPFGSYWPHVLKEAQEDSLVPPPGWAGDSFPQSTRALQVQRHDTLQQTGLAFPLESPEQDVPLNSMRLAVPRKLKEHG